ncbi:MAG TPA: sialidase family protein [Candidatus Eremiobacteraceae bacterium]
MVISSPSASKRWRLVLGSALAAALVTAGITARANLAPNGPPIVQISQDTFVNHGSQHQTEVEPGSYGFGNTVVVAYQTGRFNLNGGSSDVSWATSIDGGKTWEYGNLPGITKYTNSHDPFDRASDPTVTYDAKHGVWLIETLPLIAAGGPRPAMVISRSTDGLRWHNPVSVGPNLGDSDKTWINCDNWSNSPHFGNCYAEWDSTSTGEVNLSTSKDGGLTWGPAKNSADGAVGQGGLPEPQPNGNVVVPFWAFGNVAIEAFTSADGGTSWGSSVFVANVNFRGPNGGIRALTLPGAGIDGSGRVYVVWADCSFRTNCSSNDIVFSSSKDGATWSAAAPIPIDPLNSTIDHFIPGFAVDPNTKGSSAHLALTYYYYPNVNCGKFTCKLHAAMISSHDGGASWAPPVELAGPIKLTWLPNTSLGRMVGDYVATSIVNGNAYAFLASADRPSGQFFEEALFTNKSGVPDIFGTRRFTPFGLRPVSHLNNQRRTVPVPLD